VHGKCAYCGANARDYDRGEGFETHAYAFIHTDDLKARLARCLEALSVRRDHRNPRTNWDKAVVMPSHFAHADLPEVR